MRHDADYGRLHGDRVRGGLRHAEVIEMPSASALVYTSQVYVQIVKGLAGGSSCKELIEVEFAVTIESTQTLTRLLFDLRHGRTWEFSINMDAQHLSFGSCRILKQ